MRDNWLKPLKLTVRRLAPRLYDPLQSAIYQRRYGSIGRTLDGIYGCRIASGPFQGMTYLVEAAGSQLLPKRLGTYEAELAPLIHAFPAAHYLQVIDIGCAEGYYAVGLALLLPAATVEAFDTDPRAQDLCGRLASLNGVSDRVRVNGECSPATLEHLVGERSLVICDCEGYESELFTPAVATALAKADVLVELHEFFAPGVTQRLQDRFANSHEIQLITARKRSQGEFTATSILSRRQARRAMDEGRPADQQWLWARSRRRDQ